MADEYGQHRFGTRPNSHVLWHYRSTPIDGRPCSSPCQHYRPVIPDFPPKNTIAVRARVPPHGPDPSRSLDRAFLQLAPFPFGQATPDAEPLVVCQRVLQALRAHVTALADALGLARRAALLREERLWL